MGVKPIWSSGRATGVTSYPSVNWKARIDAVVTMSGLFRNVYGQVAILMDIRLPCSILQHHPQPDPRGFRGHEAAVKPLRPLSFHTGNDTLEMNYVAKHWLQLATKYIDAVWIRRLQGTWQYTDIAPPLGSYSTVSGGVKCHGPQQHR